MNYIYKNQSLNTVFCNELSEYMCSEKIQIQCKYSKYVLLPTAKQYNHLYYNINQHINLYIDFLNSQSAYIPYKYFDSSTFYISNFTIYKFDKTHIDELFDNIKIDFTLYTYSVFRFIWVLNSIDNEIVFLNNEKIKTSIGEIYIFPCDWCFPFTDTNITDTKYFIIGHVEV